MDQPVRWTVRVSKETEVAVRIFLAQRGTKKGDLAIRSSSGLVGVYRHIDKKHLNRYLAEFDFRQNTRAKSDVNDTRRAAIAVEAFKGKRLTMQPAEAH